MTWQDKKICTWPSHKAVGDCVEIPYKGLLRAAAIFVNDKQPGARKSARRLILQLREAYIGTKIERKAEDWLEFVDVTLGKAACAKILGMK
mmetsp:Transcript_29306/g.72499  ORF Transcript_29306/g.72499 Transcript_29306/m.72499 type:complete len:91 (+) Transcript_29306:1298-1570(+)